MTDSTLDKILDKVSVHPVIGVVVDKASGSGRKSERSSNGNYHGFGVPGTSIGVGLYVGMGVSRKKGVTPDIGGGFIVGSTGIYFATHATIGYRWEEKGGIVIGILLPVYRLIGFEQAAAMTLGYYVPDDGNPFSSLIKGALYTIAILPTFYGLYNVVKDKDKRRVITKYIKSKISSVKSKIGL